MWEGHWEHNTMLSCCFHRLKLLIAVLLVLFLRMEKAYQIPRHPSLIMLYLRYTISARVALWDEGLILFFRNENLARGWDSQISVR